MLVLKNSPSAALRARLLDEREKKRASIDVFVSKINAIATAFHFEDFEFNQLATELASIPQAEIDTEEELKNSIVTLDGLYDRASAIVRRIERKAQQKIVEEKIQLDAAVEKHLDNVRQLAQEAVKVGLRSDFDLSAYDRLRNALDLVQKTEGFPEALRQFSKEFQALVARNSQRIQGLQAAIIERSKEKK